jgi:hypothetical protein
MANKRIKIFPVHQPYHCWVKNQGFMGNLIISGCDEWPHVDSDRCVVLFVYYATGGRSHVVRSPIRLRPITMSPNLASLFVECVIFFLACSLVCHVQFCLICVPSACFSNIVVGFHGMDELQKFQRRLNNLHTSFYIHSGYRNKRIAAIFWTLRWPRKRDGSLGH